MSSLAQNIMLPTINFESTVRDTMIQFPDVDHTQYEKILMHYSMRCKDALVSTVNERNLGCGEWDFSCNTYIVDESRVDSLRQISSQFDFLGNGNDVLNYTDDQTYTQRQIMQTYVEYSSVTSERAYDVVMGSEELDYQFGAPGRGLELVYVLSASDLESNGVDASEGITGISFPIADGSATLTNLKVYMQPTLFNEMHGSITRGDWTQLIHHNTTLDSDNNTLRFFQEYDWDGTSNIAVRITYDIAEGEGITLEGDSPGRRVAQYTDVSNDRYWAFGPSGHFDIDGDFSSIQDEITISFWNYGFHNLPVASTIINGLDDDDNRQINVHLPWGNGNVFWDCGSTNGNFDRISRGSETENIKNQWNHWAFTKNATTGVMEIFLNGESWWRVENRTRPIDITKFRIGGNFGGNLFYYGRMDEFQIYNKVLDEEEIVDYMNAPIDDSHPNFEDLVVYYDFNSEAVGEILDMSGNGNNGMVQGIIYDLPRSVENSLATDEISDFIPNHSIRQDVVEIVATEVVETFSYPNLPLRVDEYDVFGTDRELVGTQFLFDAESSVLLDVNGDVIGLNQEDIVGTINAGELVHYTKRPMEFEIMSFVTPYGINLDFGEEGRTWTFDVTHMGPILKGNKRMYLTRGGQWQEDMDIRFEYIEGTPDRNVLDVQNIWPTSGRVRYQDIQSEARFEPRMLSNDNGVNSYVIRSAITGHGQEGEFIPRNHTVSVGGFEDTWTVWKECAENPVFPQGGTWVFDRAGWCPGMATDVREWDVTEFFRFLDTPMLDYNIPVASGTSDYIISTQLVSYGSPNKTLDLAIEDVIYPNAEIEHGRFNPTCLPPMITIKNHGGDMISTATIEYGVVGKSEQTYTWNGNLPFLDEETIELNFLPQLTVSEEGDMFYARVASVNGQADTYNNNDEYVTDMLIQDHYDGALIIEMRTNNAANETSFRVSDTNDTQVLFRGANLSANTIYLDTIRNLNGCYKLTVNDAGDDGLSFFANNDGNGYIRVREEGGAWNVIGTDFGDKLNYVFTMGTVTDTEDLSIETLKLFPNPGDGNVFIENMKDWKSEVELLIVDQLGHKVMAQSMATQTLLDQGVPGLDSAPAGVYFININDGVRRSNVKYVKTTVSR
jgi:hypothetical protein